MSQGATRSYRYAAKISSTWNREQLFTAIFIQSLGSKQVFQSAWNTPNISLESLSGVLLVGSGQTAKYKITNNSTKSQNLAVTLSAASAPTSWNLQITDLP